jgi:hypothetical protein
MRTKEKKKEHIIAMQAKTQSDSIEGRSKQKQDLIVKTGKM